MLVRSFATRFANKLGKNIETIPQNVMKAFQAYPWPGNVRELENVIERAVILAQDDTLRMEESFEVRDVPVRGTSGKATLEEAERAHILGILAQTEWVISGQHGAAQILGVNPNTLRSRMQKLGIKRSTSST